MKHRIFRLLLIATVFILLILINLPFEDKTGTKYFTLPGLPRPIAKASVLITSAGQNTDTYIIHDISNQLMIRSYFMPQASDVNLKDINTIAFVVGYSSLGMKLQDISFEEEKLRIEKLLDNAKDNDLKVLTVVLGGKHTNDMKTEELLRLIGSGSDYLIGLRESGKVNVLIELAREGNIPLTLVGGVKDILEPYASAFR